MRQSLRQFLGGDIPTAADCATCHIQRKPSNHYYGACQVCHTAPLLGTVFVSWKSAVFTHPVETDCAACHTTKGWPGATFDHNNTGFALTGEATKDKTALQKELPAIMA